MHASNGQMCAWGAREVANIGKSRIFLPSKWKKTWCLLFTTAIINIVLSSTMRMLAFQKQTAEAYFLLYCTINCCGAQKISRRNKNKWCILIYVDDLPFTRRPKHFSLLLRERNLGPWFFNMYIIFHILFTGIEIIVAMCVEKYS